MALMLSHWSKISHAIFNLREHSKTTCHWMETAECFGLNGLDSLFCLASCTSQRCPGRDPHRRLWTSLSSYCSLLSDCWSPVRNRNRVSVRLVRFILRVSNERVSLKSTQPAFANRCFCLHDGVLLSKPLVLLLYILEMHNLLMTSIICLRSVCTNILAQKSFQEWCMLESNPLDKWPWI